MPQHVCPIAGCPELVDADKIMCRDHWRLVPGDLQTKIWRSWSRAYGQGRSVETRKLWRKAHHENVREAIEAVLGKITEIPKAMKRFAPITK